MPIEVLAQSHNVILPIKVNKFLAKFENENSQEFSALESNHVL